MLQIISSVLAVSFSLQYGIYLHFDHPPPHIWDSFFSPASQVAIFLFFSLRPTVGAPREKIWEFITQKGASLRPLSPFYIEFSPFFPLPRLELITKKHAFLRPFLPFFMPFSSFFLSYDSRPLPPLPRAKFFGVYNPFRFMSSFRQNWIKTLNVSWKFEFFSLSKLLKILYIVYTLESESLLIMPFCIKSTDWQREE